MGWCTVNDKYQVIVNLCRSWGNKQDSFVCYPCISHLGFKQTVMIIENSCPIFHLCSSAVEEVETSLAITSPSLPMPICTACPPASIWYKIFILQRNQSCQSLADVRGAPYNSILGVNKLFHVQCVGWYPWEGWAKLDKILEIMVISSSDIKNPSKIKTYYYGQVFLCHLVSALMLLNLVQVLQKLNKCSSD